MLDIVSTNEFNHSDDCVTAQEIVHQTEMYYTLYWIYIIGIPVFNEAKDTWPAKTL